MTRLLTNVYFTCIHFSYVATGINWDICDMCGRFAAATLGRKQAPTHRVTRYEHAKSKKNTHLTLININDV